MATAPVHSSPASVAGQVVAIPRSSLKPDPDNPRQTVDEGYIAGLAASIKLQGVMVPLIVKSDYAIIDGWCRYLASGRAGLEKLPCIVVTQPLNPGQILAMQMATVLHRADISPYEKWQACERMLKLNPSWQQKDLAPNLSVSESMIVRLLSPGKCSYGWQEALKAGKVGISEVYEASKIIDPEAQADLLALKLSGASRDVLARASRKHRNGSNGDADSVKVTRLACKIPGRSATITISGQNLSLTDAIEAVTDWLKLAKKAAEEGLSAKTFAKALADKCDGK